MPGQKAPKKVIKTNNSKLNRELIAVTLHETIMRFKKEFNIIDENYHLPKEIDDLFNKHFSDVMGIIRQHMIINMVTKTGRPKNDAAREFFRNEVNQHQMKSSHNGDFPSEKEFFDQLSKLNYDLIKNGCEEILIDPKTFRNLKKEWKEGFFN
jgi:hypothetical protein